MKKAIVVFMSALLTMIGLLAVIVNSRTDTWYVWLISLLIGLVIVSPAYGWWYSYFKDQLK